MALGLGSLVWMSGVYAGARCDASFADPFIVIMAILLSLVYFLRKILGNLFTRWILQSLGFLDLMAGICAVE